MCEVTVNNVNEVFNVPCGNGYTCYSFKYINQMNRSIRDELCMATPVASIGTIEQYEEYERAINAAKSRFEKHNMQMDCGLHPKLKGLEGYRIECIRNGEKVRFWVGKSTGWIPSHLAIHNTRSRGGDAISLNDTLSDIVIIQVNGRYNI